MTNTFDAVLAEMPLPDTYSHTEVMFRNDKDTKWVRREDFDWHMKQQANRLSAAHAAEVAGWRAQDVRRIAEAQGQQSARLAAEARAEAAERGARELRVDIAKAYAMIPSLPVAPETCDAATDALHWVGLMMGLHDIDPAIATTDGAP